MENLLKFRYNLNWLQSILKENSEPTCICITKKYLMLGIFLHKHQIVGRPDSNSKSNPGCVNGQLPIVTLEDSNMDA